MFSTPSLKERAERIGHSEIYKMLKCWQSCKLWSFLHTIHQIIYSDIICSKSRWDKGNNCLSTCYYQTVVHSCFPILSTASWSGGLNFVQQIVSQKNQLNPTPEFTFVIFGINQLMALYGFAIVHPSVLLRAITAFHSHFVVSSGYKHVGLEMLPFKNYHSVVLVKCCRKRK